MAKLKVTCNNQSCLNKLDTLGADHDSPVQEAKERISFENSKLNELKGNIKSFEQYQQSCHPGFAIAFDNIDLEIGTTIEYPSCENILFRLATWLRGYLHSRIFES